MDSSLKKGCVDRLSSLPYELICQILSSLPTKDAFVAGLTSKKIMSTFSSLTTLDFDDSPISYCGNNNPQFVERFQFFKKFVDSVLQPSQSPHLTKFRLGFGGDLEIKADHKTGFNSWRPDCGENCFPYMESTYINSWIGFPLSRCGVKEIDLRIHVRNPGMLPSAFFACETLDVLKLDTNLDCELISSMALFRLPNLKVLQLHSVVIPEDEFVHRLVANCPLLEELSLHCWWKHGKSVTISSPSLQKLRLFNCQADSTDPPGDSVAIDTPNLKCFEYEDILAVHYCIASMKALVDASIRVSRTVISAEKCFPIMVRLVSAMCNVQHLSLLGLFMVKVLGHGDLSNQMPVFHNLKHLELGPKTTLIGSWDTVLFEFLMHSPVLEILEFPSGMYCFPIHPPITRAEQERWVFRKNQSSPCCCKPHLKRIVIKQYCGTTNELELVRFLVEKAPVLEELLVILSKQEPMPGANVDRELLESTMKELPMASSTCLIIVQ